MFAFLWEGCINGSDLLVGIIQKELAMATSFVLPKKSTLKEIEAEIKRGVDNLADEELVRLLIQTADLFGQYLPNSKEEIEGQGDCSEESHEEREILRKISIELNSRICLGRGYASHL